MRTLSKFIEGIISAVLIGLAANAYANGDYQMLGIFGICAVLSLFIFFHKRKKKVEDMTGMEFENYCAELLLRDGLDLGLLKKVKFREVSTTPASGDYGADLIATDRRRKVWVIQCKCYKGTVGNSAVQEAVAAKAHYEADEAAVMTNSRLSANAKRLAEENDVVVIEEIR